MREGKLGGGCAQSSELREGRIGVENLDAHPRSKVKFSSSSSKLSLELAAARWANVLDRFSEENLRSIPLAYARLPQASAAAAPPRFQPRRHPARAGRDTPHTTHTTPTCTYHDDLAVVRRRAHASGSRSASATLRPPPLRAWCGELLRAYAWCAAASPRAVLRTHAIPSAIL